MAKVRATAEQDPLKIFLRIHKEFFAPIGELTIAFSILESSLTWAIGHCLRINREEASSIEATILSVNSRIKLFHTLGLLQTKSKLARAELKKLIIELERLNGLRNNVLHGSWPYVATGGGKETQAAKLRYPVGKDFSINMRWHTVSEIRQGAREMIYLHHNLIRWGGNLTLERQGTV